MRSPVRFWLPAPKELPIHRKLWMGILVFLRHFSDRILFRSFQWKDAVCFYCEKSHFLNRKIIFSLYKTSDVCYNGNAKLIEYCKTGIISQWERYIFFSVRKKSLNLIKCKFRLFLCEMLYHFCKRLVWRLSEFAFLCVCFGRRTFLF